MSLVNAVQLSNLAIDFGSRLQSVASDPIVRRDAAVAASDVRRAAASVTQLALSTSAAWTSGKRTVPLTAVS